MVYLGASKGCKTCRNRKVKCDEARPECQRCKKSKRDCLGYEHLDAREQNEVTRQKRRSSRSTPVIRAATDDGSRSNQARPRYGDPQARIQPCPEQEALRLLMEGVTVRRHQEAAGRVTKALPQLYATAPANSALMAVTLAYAMGRMATYLERPDYMRISNFREQQAVRKVNEAIGNGEACRSDHVVQAVLMLEWMENGRRWLCSTPSETEFLGEHIKGAATMLKLRAQQNVPNHQMSSEVYLSVKFQLVQYCIRTSDIKTLEDFLESTTSMSRTGNPGMTVDDRSLEALIAIGRLKSRAALPLSGHGGADLNHVQNILDDAKAADSELLEMWDAQILADPRFRSKPLRREDEKRMSSLGAAHRVSEEDDHDPYPYVNMHWNKWRSSRVQILDVIVQCATILEDIQATHGQCTNCVSASAVASIQWLVDGMCSSVAYIFGKLEESINEKPVFPYVTGRPSWSGIAGKVWRGFALDPLREVVDVQCIPEDQRRWMTASVEAVSASNT